MIDSNAVRTRIEEALPGSAVSVRDMTGGGDHYDVEVISDLFAGKSLLERHRMVYAPLGDVLGGALHALALKTKTPGEK